MIDRSAVEPLIGALYTALPPGSLRDEIDEKLDDWFEGLGTILEMSGEYRWDPLGDVFFASFNPAFDERRRRSFREAYYAGQPLDTIMGWCRRMTEIDEELRSKAPKAAEAFEKLVMNLHPASARFVAA